jgi:hypothetical protein
VKIQEILAQYLYKEKSLTLPGLGHFALDPTVNLTDTKEQVWPDGAITFTMDRQAQLSDELLTFLVQQTGKMKPLALSDLESYISTGLQLINIGKPFLIKGIGSLTKNQTAQLQFEQGNPVLEKIDSINTDHVRDRTVLAEGETEIDFSHEERKNSKKPILIFGSIIALALVGWAVWLAIPKKETAPVSTDTETEQVAVDTPAAAMDTSAIVVKDSTPVTPPDSAFTANVPTATGTFRLQVDAFKTMAAAENRVAKLKLRGFDVRAEMKDSSRYIVVLQVNRPLSDSSYVMDSLRKNYLWKPKLLQ